MGVISIRKKVFIDVESVRIILSRSVGNGCRWGIRIKNPERLRVRVHKPDALDTAPPAAE